MKLILVTIGITGLVVTATAAVFAINHIIVNGNNTSAIIAATSMFTTVINSIVALMANILKGDDNS